MRELFPPGELTEFAGFVAAVNCGLVIGIMYDLFALLRKPFKSAGQYLSVNAAPHTRTLSCVSSTHSMRFSVKMCTFSGNASLAYGDRRE